MFAEFRMRIKMLRNWSYWLIELRKSQCEHYNQGESPKEDTDEMPF